MLEKVKKIGMHILRFLFGVGILLLSLGIVMLFMFNPWIPMLGLGLAVICFIGFMCYGMGYLFFPDKEVDEELVQAIEKDIDFEKAELQADSEVALKHLEVALNTTDKDTFVDYVKKAYMALGGTKYNV